MTIEAKVIPMGAALKAIVDMAGSTPAGLKMDAATGAKYALMVHVSTEKLPAFELAGRGYINEDVVGQGKSTKVADTVIFSTPHEGGRLAFMRHSPELVEALVENQLLPIEAEHTLRPARTATGAGGLSGGR